MPFLSRRRNNYSPSRFLKAIINLLFDVHFETCERNVLFLNDPLFKNKQILYTFSILFSLAKRSIWTIRNEVKFDYVSFNTNLIYKKFLQFLNFRVTTDYNRLSTTRFDQTWCCRQVICSLEENSFTFDLT